MPKATTLLQTGTKRGRKLKITGEMSPYGAFISEALRTKMMSKEDNCLTGFEMSQ